MTRGKIKIFTSPIKQKILLLLQAGAILGLTRSVRKRNWVFKHLKKDWKSIDRQYLYRIIHEFKNERLVDWKEKNDGTIEAVLTERGEKTALKFNFDEMSIKKPASWDGKWRVVLYDVPESRKKAREALRHKLRDLGFCELQKSVFVYPFPCKNEIDFAAEFFEIRNCIHYGETDSLSNDAHLRLHFELY